jgi:2-keto-4-pentenoate hydratase/2-oxohepta-3-ene-1,7-dioic acid hydratase in catechol pathway
MRFVTYSHAGSTPKLGLLDPKKGTIADLSGHSAGNDLIDLVAAGAAALTEAQAIADADKAPIAVLDATLLAPVPRPRRNIFCVGKNYFEHSKEFEKSGFDSSSGGAVVPDAPVVFTKAPSTVIGNGELIPAHLDHSKSTDYEGELGVVIGNGGRGITKDKAYDHVFGYTIINDVTARKLQNHHKQWFLGKSVDGFCPMGPCVVTADEIGDVTKLVLTTDVNGERRQDACVADLIFDIPTIIETISRTMTIEAGDVIATGTPVGVGIGFDPPRFLKSGDVVRIAIDGIGVLENPVA